MLINTETNTRSNRLLKSMLSMSHSCSSGSAVLSPVVLEATGNTELPVHK